MSDEITFAFEWDGDISVVDGDGNERLLYVKVLIAGEVGDDYDPGDYDTPSAGGPFGRVLAIRVLRIEDYVDEANIWADFGPMMRTDIQAVSWLPYSLDQIGDIWCQQCQADDLVWARSSFATENLAGESVRDLADRLRRMSSDDPTLVMRDPGGKISRLAEGR